MFQDHDYCELPHDQTIIWRYMDFERFVNLLETGSLFFSRVDNLGDQHEGKVPKETIEAWRARIQTGQYTEGTLEDLDRHINFLHNENRRISMVNCWSICMEENFALWKIYSKNNLGVAIRTLVGNFKRCFDPAPEKINIGTVNYTKRDNKDLRISNTLFPIFNKIEFYHYETELRAYTQEYDEGYTPRYDKGKHVRVDLKTLITDVRLAPGASNKHYKEISELLATHGIDAKILHSSIVDTSF